MAGILTVSAPVGDFNVQPCKKQRKEEEPPVKTITNYFSPVSKPADKELPSPRSSSIADYFKRSSPATERPPNTDASGPHRDGIQGAHTPPSRDPGRLRKRGQRPNLCRRLNDPQPRGECGDGRAGFLGSDTAALLAHICSNCDDLHADNKSHSPPAAKTHPPDNKKPAKPDRQTAANLPENRPGDTSLKTPEEPSLGPNTGDAPRDGLITVSFEDFLRSREEKDSGVTSDPKHETPGNSHSDATEPGSGESALHLSPNTMTVHAQVHLSRPLPDSCPQSKTPKKIAAIFLRKGDGELGRRANQTSPEAADPLLQKRKSNVVIAEEDLELAVLEADSEPVKQKSTAAERHQFLKAFRQAGDPAKSTGRKGPPKKRDSGETSAANNCESKPDETAGDAVPVDESEDTTQKESTSEEKEATPKLTKRANKATRNTDAKATPISRKKARESAAPDAEPSQSPAGAALRRSSRHRKSDTTSLMSPAKRSLESDSLRSSTPKAQRLCRKSDIYKAEVLTEQSEGESPIRIRFTRLSSRRDRYQTVAEDDLFTPRSKKVSGSSKKIIKAKKLLDKAKVIQQNMAKSETPQRRSARRRPENKSALEDSVVVIDITGDTKATKNTNLRSLNDVLGKKAKKRKPCKVFSGQKNSARRAPAPIMVISDSSEASENSQDDQQFKAKREFLMSGLPDSLKKHISKTAAFMEAYSLSSSFFQKVLHVQQKDGSLMWSLGLPTCPRLAGLCCASADAPSVAKLHLSLGEVTLTRNTSAIRLYSSAVKAPPALSDGVCDRLLEEISASNPAFPVKRFFHQFVRKQRDQPALEEPRETGNQLADRRSRGTEGEAILLEDGRGTEPSYGAKRKRGYAPVTASKRLKAETQHDCSVKPHTPPGSSPQDTRATTARKYPNAGEKQPFLPDEDISGFMEEVLWTEKYQPCNSSELVGNHAAVKRLHGWLKDWKVRAEKEEKRNQMNKSDKEKSDTWEQNDFTDGSESEEESLCNTLLITGPPGVGKTAAVYACAQELGFKVFEVNASSQRNGRQILAQLKEATQSHQVDQQGVNAHRPSFFSSYSTGKSPRKLSSPRSVVSSPRKPPPSPRGGLRKALAPKSLANYFRAPSKQQNEDVPTPEGPQGAQNITDGKTTTKSLFLSKERKQRPGEPPRRTATSLILFEEVDVIFDDDSGFLSAIKTFMTTTKRPVILTTSDPTFGLIFDGVFEEIKFETPSVADVASFLQVVCLAENLRTDTKDFATFLSSSKCDVRQSLLRLQFWAKSGGGLREKQLSCGRKPSASPKTNPPELPGCNSGCAEHTAGLHNILPPGEGLIHFLKSNVAQAEGWSRVVQLLTEFQMKGTDLISSNLELLLPLPARPLGSDDRDARRDKLAEARPEEATKRRRNVLDDSDLFESNSSSLDEILGVTSGNSPPAERKKAGSGESRGPKLTEEERWSSDLVGRCLGSLAEFVDNMSHMDCFTYRSASPTELRASNWTESRVKDGLCDGVRGESRDWWSEQSSRELRATVEALAFQKCSSDISTAVDSLLERCKGCGKDPSEDLTLRVSRDTVSFSQSASNPEVADRRLSVVRSVLSNRAFLNLGNRQANVTEYLPVLRTICRAQKLKEQEKAKRRFLHYFEGIHLELPKETIRSLAADFP